MKKLVPIMLFPFLFTISSFGQINAWENLGSISISPTLFDSTSIRKNRISKVYVIETSGQRDADGIATKNDTISIYWFDKSGRPVKGIDFDIHNRTSYNFTLSPTKTSGDRKSESYLDSTVVTIKDSNHIFKFVYNRQGQISEEQCWPTARLLKIADCIVGDYRHLKYEYDKTGRIICYRDLRKNESKRVSYFSYGRLIETIDDKSSSVKDGEFILINSVGEVTTMTDKTRQIIIVRDPDTGMIYQLSITEIGTIPTTSNYNLKYE